MALPLPSGLLELLNAEVRAPIEWITLMGQCDVAHLKGILVSSGPNYSSKSSPCREPEHGHDGNAEPLT